jgi:hypothetical protein
MRLQDPDLTEWEQVHRRWKIAMTPRIPEKKPEARDAVVILNAKIPIAPGRLMFPIDRYVTTDPGEFILPALSAAEVYGDKFNPDDW